MASMKTPDVNAAEWFLAGHARVLEVRRFEHLITGGDATPIRDAVAAYRNADGGFGHGLEPDCRCPGSQPMAIEFALRTMHDADVWDLDLVGPACDWLEEHAPADGGAVFVDPCASGWPAAPWYVPADGNPPSLISTGNIAGTLHARGVTHPWLDRATTLVWTLIDTMSGTEPHEILGAMAFLDHVPDRDRAQEAVLRLGRHIVDNKLVKLDPTQPGYVHTPLEYAPLPQSLGRVLFDQAVVDAHLDHLIADQRDDGGWMFTFQVWSPVTEQAWRGHLTVEALRVLRANGRW